MIVPVEVSEFSRGLRGRGDGVVTATSGDAVDLEGDVGKVNREGRNTGEGGTVGVPCLPWGGGTAFGSPRGVT